jgi:hypothetical protein
VKSPPESGDATNEQADEPLPWWDYRSRAARAGASWAQANPRGTMAFLYLFTIAGGILGIWWAVVGALTHPGGGWLPAAFMGALLATAGTGFWAYVAVVRQYQIGWVGRALSYVYIYGALGGALFAIVTRDSVSAWSVFGSALAGASLILSTPLMAFGRRRYGSDPQRAHEIMARARWLPMNPVNRRK